jgi:hypothetical protein
MEHCRNQKIIDDMEKALFGNGRPGLKDDYLGFKSQMTTSMKVLMWLFGLQFAATMGAMAKMMFFGG